MASITAQLQLLRQLEGQLRKLSKERGFHEPAVRDARRQLRAAAEGVVLQNHDAAEEQGVELKLWHQCFHSPVQHFRRRLAEAKARGERGRELHAKLSKAFGELLRDGAAFYKLLAAKLQLSYGDAGWALPAADHAALWPRLEAVQPAGERRDVSASVARCLICAGDLTRYLTQASPEAEQDWGQADDFYAAAARVYPQGGNAFNQRAVLAGYQGRSLAAVYHYTRALHVPAPFPPARENLRQLFESLRQQQRPLPPAGERALHGRTLPQLLQAATLRWLHLQGLLFTQIDLDTFQPVIRAAVAELDCLLERQAVVAGPVGHGPEASHAALLQLAALAVGHPAEPPPAGLSQQEAARAGELRQAALDQSFVLTGRLARALAVAAASSPLGVADSPLLPALACLLQWLAAHPHQLRDAEAREGTRSYLCRALAELAVAAAASCEKAGLPLQQLQQQQQAGGSQAGGRWAPLPEDCELRGFGPLAAFQAERLDFALPPPAEEATERLQRVAALLLGIANDMAAAGLADSAGCAGARRAVAAFLAQARRCLRAPAPALPQPPAAPAPAAPAAAEDGPTEEGGEVIVFQPGGAPAEALTSPPGPSPQQGPLPPLPPPAPEQPAVQPAAAAADGQPLRRDWDPFGGGMLMNPPAQQPAPEAAGQAPPPLQQQLSQELPSRPSTRASSPPPLQQASAGARPPPPGFPLAEFGSSRPASRAATPAAVDVWAGLGGAPEAGGGLGVWDVPVPAETYAGFAPRAPDQWRLPPPLPDGQLLACQLGQHFDSVPGTPATPLAWPGLGGAALSGSAALASSAALGGSGAFGGAGGLLGVSAPLQQPGTDFAALQQLLAGGAGAGAGAGWQQGAGLQGAGWQASGAAAQQAPGWPAPLALHQAWDGGASDASWLDAFEAKQKQLASSAAAGADRGLR